MLYAVKVTFSNTISIAETLIQSISNNLKQAHSKKKSVVFSVSAEAFDKQNIRIYACPQLSPRLLDRK
jgi:hypothetical protein